MAWEVNGQNLSMAEGDYGVELPLTISGIDLGASDYIKVSFKDKKNGNVILEKEFNEFNENTVNIVFTESESALFPVGIYVYRLDWYQAGNFMCNIIECANFKVVDVA
jgi:hypothetical protein